MKLWGLNPPNFCQASKVNLRMSKKAGNKQAFDFVTIPGHISNHLMELTETDFQGKPSIIKKAISQSK